MMGIKERNFRPLPDNLSLEALVPRDNFYRRLQERVDLSFVRELVLPLYAKGGRHSIDPVVFFKLQLVLFFENLRSERQLMEVVADRLSLRWYLGYDLDERLPDHSSLTKIRERYGVRIFRRFFERIVEECVEAGLVRGEELFIDSTKIEANAAVDSLASKRSSKPISTTSSTETQVKTRRRARRTLRTRGTRGGPRTRDPPATCPRQKTRISFGETVQAKTGSPAMVPRSVPSRELPGASGPRTPGPRGPTPTPPP